MVPNKCLFFKRFTGAFFLFFVGFFFKKEKSSKTKTISSTSGTNVQNRQ